MPAHIADGMALPSTHNFRREKSECGGKAECECGDARVEDGLFCELINPEASSVKPRVRFRVAGEIARDDVSRGEFAGGERVVNSFASEGLHDSRRVADEQEIRVRAKVLLKRNHPQ